MMSRGLPTAPLLAWLEERYPVEVTHPNDPTSTAVWATLCGVSRGCIAKWRRPGATTQWWIIDDVCTELAVHPETVYKELWHNDAKLDIDKVLKLVRRSQMHLGDLGDIIRSTRQGLGLSERQLADALGMNNVDLHRIEKGERSIPYKHKAALIAWLKEHA
jgi:DNA-binding transcriptional regulator YiaG